ncbi:MAG: DUF4390 domain-containing protein [Gammaproteobacteria bacterium]|nr:DUF4390 domain-containing protein [Gammaproteobacteria bacterium]
MQANKKAPPATQIRGSTRSAMMLIGALCLLAASAAEAQQGRFDVRSATTGLRDGVYYLTARIDYRLSKKALEALESGVALTIQLQIDINRNRNFLPDTEIASLRQDYLLSYQPLSQRYVVKNVNSGEQTSYATLFSALNSLGRIRDLPVIDESLLDRKGRYDIRVRSVLDQNTLPGPLRIFSFWGNSFRLASEWYTWTLRE